jgi:hypothetical protein
MMSIVLPAGADQSAIVVFSCHGKKCFLDTIIHDPPDKLSSTNFSLFVRTLLIPQTLSSRELDTTSQAPRSNSDKRGENSCSALIKWTMKNTPQGPRWRLNTYVPDWVWNPLHAITAPHLSIMSMICSFEDLLGPSSL